MSIYNKVLLWKSQREHLNAVFGIHTTNNAFQHSNQPVNSEEQAKHKEACLKLQEIASKKLIQKVEEKPVIPCEICGAEVSLLEYEAHFISHQAPALPMNQQENGIPCDLCQTMFSFDDYGIHMVLKHQIPQKIEEVKKEGRKTL